MTEGTARTKVTLLVDDGWRMKAADLVGVFLRSGYAPRAKLRDCVVYAVGPTSFGVWGDERHVRVYQETK
jgi:hypothetical protein